MHARILLSLAILFFVSLAAIAARPADSTITVQVIDKATGDPIAQAAVTTHQEEGFTDDYGQCTVAVPEAGRYLDIRVSKDGYATLVDHWQAIPLGQKIPNPLVFKMDPGISIGGTVVDESGKPVAGATVSFNGNYYSIPDGEIHPEVTGEMHTDNAGKWSIHVLPAALKYSLANITHPDFSDGSFSLDYLPINKLRDHSVALTMYHSVTITGRVLDPAGNPVANANVIAGDAGWYAIRHRTRTNGNGEFSLTQMSASGAAFSVFASNYAPTMTTLAAPTTQPVVVHLAPGATMTLHVVDTSGKPLPDVTIDVDQWENSKNLDLHFRTDNAGNAIWKNAPSDEVKLNLSKPGFGEIFDAPATATTQPITITLGTKTQIHGNVIDAATGKPIKDFTLLIGTAGDKQQEIYWPKSIPKKEHDGQFVFSVGDVENPQYEIRIQATGYLTCDSRRFTRAEGDVTMDFKLVKGAPILGTLYGLDRKPVAHARIFLANNPDFPTQIEDKAQISAWAQQQGEFSQTDAQGHFSFPAEDKAFDLISITDDGYAQLNVPALHPPDPATNMDAIMGYSIPGPTTRPASCDLVLQPWATVQGQLMIGSKPGGEEKIALTISQAERILNQPRIEFQYYVMTDDAGQFRFQRVPPGTATIYRIIHHENSYAYSEATFVKVVAGKTASISIGGKGRPIVGRFAYPQGIQPATWDPMHARISTHIDMPEGPDMPAAIKKASPDAQNKWLLDWAKSDRGKAFIAANRKNFSENNRRNYALQTEPDCSFRADDVPAGTYDLMVTFYPHGPMTNEVFMHPVGSATKRVVVPPMPGGRSDTPLDIGTVPVQPETQGQ